MPTSGGYTPPAAPPCPYAPRMTRAAALALRTAGTLNENCIVVITDGPTIGTAGNTSVTEITLQPTASNELSMIAEVNTTFDNASWSGLYDIDTNSIIRLTDNNNNTVVDTDSAAPTVHTQWPWHLSNAATLRDNYIEDVNITSPTTIGTFNDNRVTGTTLNFTGKTAGVITGNDIGIGYQWIIAGDVTVRQTKWRTDAGVGVNNFQTSAGSTTVIDDCDFSGGFAIRNTGTGVLTLNEVRGSGQAPGAFDVEHQGAAATTANNCDIIAFSVNALSSIFNGSATGTLTVQTCHMNEVTLQKLAGSTGTATYLDCEGEFSTWQSNATNAGAVAVTRTKTSGSNLVFNGGAVTITDNDYWVANVTTGGSGAAHTSVRSKFVNYNYTNTGSGSCSIDDSVFIEYVITRVLGATGALTISNSQFALGTITQAAGAVAGTMTFSDVDYRFANVTQNGTGIINLFRVHGLTCNISNTAAATRSLQITDSQFVQGTVVQQRTLNANFDTIANSRVAGLSTVNLLGAAGGAANTVVISGCTIDNGSTVNITDPIVGTNMGNSVVQTQSTLNIQAGGFINRSRIANQATVNTGAFGHDQCIIELPETVTLAAANTNRLHNKSFSDILV